jgi:LuxR family transcriptional regulator, maltose regulon positive regulatory protein
MAHSTPHVEQGTLTLPGVGGEQHLAVGSPAWFRWVETAMAFTFAGQQGRFTARRERTGSGRGGWYWRAYVYRNGTRQRAYLGLAAELSLERLETIAAQLAATSSSVSERLTEDDQQQTSETRARPAARASAPQLLATKLYLPRMRPDLVLRPRLFTRLDEGLHGSLTLVCAPAGFGKTTLVSAWVRHTGRPTAWLALDSGDNDLIVLLRYLVAALQTLAPQVGAGLSGLLQSPPPPSETLLTALLNDMMRLPPNSILVLDDYHALEAASVHQAVGFLLQHLPPTLHLVIVTRVDPPLPLARMRARSQVSELRTEQLRFLAAEVTTFLTEVMGLTLTATDTAALAVRTEGWIAGLQLAAIAMRDLNDQASFIAAFTGSNRFVVDYLADEVLANQPPQIQRFLLQTSILERMCGPLCDSLLGHADATHAVPTGSVASQQLLEQLERDNLFVIPLDAERQWYRYHHLFAEVLRERLRRNLPAQTMTTLHQQASAWYARSNFISFV